MSQVMMGRVLTNQSELFQSIVVTLLLKLYVRLPLGEEGEREREQRPQSKRGSVGKSVNPSVDKHLPRAQALWGLPQLPARGKIFQMVSF